MAKHQDNEELLLLAVDFQDFFDNDTVSFYIEDCLIFENVKLTSNGVLGMTGIGVRVYENEDGEVFVVYKKQCFQCAIIKEKIRLKTILNSEVQEFIINIKEGKYVGLGIADNGKIYPFQSEYRFQYH